MLILDGYSFFDSGDIERLGRKKPSPFSDIGKCKAFIADRLDVLWLLCAGKVIPLAEY